MLHSLSVLSPGEPLSKLLFFKFVFASVTRICASAGRKNVLFFVIDDMRANLGAYNYSLAHTPAIDRLAATGLRFDHAYVQFAWCSPSRNSFMTGRRPDTNRVWEFKDSFREVGPVGDWVTLPEYFKKHGYLTLGSGKLFHPVEPGKENWGMDNNDYPASWSEEFPYVEAKDDGDHICLNGDPAEEHNEKGKRTLCIADVRKEDSVLSDQRVRDSCVQQLRLAANFSARAGSKYRFFFIGCGFHKPHVPWTVPKEFFDVLPLQVGAYPLAEHPYAPTGMPPIAWHEPGDVGGMNQSFNGTSGNETRARLYRRSYDAAIAYTDYNIGRVIEELDALHLANDTLVVLFGDHGWNLGEQALWSKMSNFELATHTPLIMRAPWKATAVNSTTAALVELVDLYLTLVELAEVPSPQLQGQKLNGTSLAPLFDDPRTSVKDAAFSQFAKTGTNLEGDFDPFNVNPKYSRNQTSVMGYSVRTDSWRYTAWFGFDDDRLVPNSTILGRELYGHRGDTGLWLDFPGETRNLADDQGYSTIAKALHERITEYIQLRPIEAFEDRSLSLIV